MAFALFSHTCEIFGFLGHCQDSPSSVQTWPPGLPTSASTAVDFKWCQNKTIEFRFVSFNMFWAWLRLILAGAVRWGLKWALRRAQSIFMPKNIKCFPIMITLEGNEKIKTEITKQSEEHFFHPCCKKTATSTVMASRFWLLLTSYNYLILTFLQFISAS